ncbi:hypothetical protein RHEC894_PE00336 (plasmid) [Rhizobium sp. CIAT894]|uniref:hypothetical protein n=1 Tax=Rhizobium sp. CIAT894 TaxID=2020312 RepID=UPI000190A1AE|nr:hypothetical protein [Rhizobium sp. CIAT894]ARM92359.1 hypothetical protein RHEC894_PE00336 [Rhizobium sp. CIAT894]
MPRRRNSQTTMLDTKGARIGEPVPKAVIDTATASVGIPRQPDHGLQEELNTLRQQIDALRQQFLDGARLVKGGAGKAMRQTEAAVKRYPASTLLLAAAAAAAAAFVFAARRASLPRHQPALRDLRELYDTIRERI